MDGIRWEQALAELDALALPPVVRDAFVEPERVPEVLRWLMRDPGEIFEEPSDPGFYPAGAITPLWADHTGHIVVGHRRSGGPIGYLRFLLEEPETIEEGLTFDQLVVHELIGVWERARDEAHAESQLHEAARHLAFAHAARLVEALRARGHASSREHDVFVASFRATL